MQEDKGLLLSIHPKHVTSNLLTNHTAAHIAPEKQGEDNLQWEICRISDFITKG